jgi:MscS family membrane protein
MRPVVRLLALLAKTVTRRTSAQWDDELVDALAGPATHLGTTGVWFASLHLLGITGGAYTVIAFLIKAAFFVNLAYLAYQLADFLGARVENRVVARRPDINQGLLRLLRQAIKVVALLFCLLLGAQNMGMDVASLIAGLGIGGLAFALAAKDTLANLLGSVMLMLDRPFRIGDAIKVKDVEGMVEEIGFRCTRIRTYHNSLVSMPNSELVMANIDNLGMRRYRRQAFTLGLTYDTPGERLEAFCEAVKNIVKNDAISRKDAIHTCFSGFGASGLEVQVLYFLETADYGEELLHRQTIALQILAAADRLGVRFAYPTQTLHVESAPGAPAPAPAPRDRERLREAAAGFAAGGAHARPDGLGLFTPRHREGV